jgi:exodeoxyribonuclease V alpha subunit
LAASAASAASAGPDGDEVDWQRLATALALRNRLTVVSGGPGTGKTSMVVQLIACMLAQDPDCRIALAAPTGKAAARMSEAVRRRAGHLPQALRARMPTTASTVHRLLGVRPGSGGFVHHAGHPLPLDLLVVDEASMLDLALATHLFEAVPDAARIVLLGDKDQLAAVESGAVFAELGTDPTLGAGCVADLAALTGIPASGIRPPRPVRSAAPLSNDADGMRAPPGVPGGSAASGALGDCVVWLTRNYRFAADSGIGRLAALVNAGEAVATLAALRCTANAGVRWLDEGGARPSAAALAAMQDGYAPFAEAVARAPHDVAAATAAFERFRVLCATREGARGVAGLNMVLQSWFRTFVGGLAAASDPGSGWYLGRPVLVRRNDPVLRLFNGDVGLTLPDRDGLPMVHFAQADGSFRAVAPVRLPAHETAFAMTVHKAQGSEFDAVLVMLPERAGPVLTRELVYTALTRARERVTLCASPHVLASAIGRATRRRSGLPDRLRECAAAVPPGAAAPIG